MNSTLSTNTKATLLLTAPLLVGRGQAASPLLKPSEYKRLAARPRELRREPADLLGAGADECLEACAAVTDAGRMRELLGRGFALSQAVERWHARAIWVVSRADPEYPSRLKKRLQADAPAVLYGCGRHAILADGGLAVVGSRAASDDLLRYTMQIGEQAASAGRPIVSGGARGVDSAAMRGALEAGGTAIGMMADSLEGAVMNREQRDMIMGDRLTLASPYDPRARFNVGNAMQRNKLIYALSDAALVVEADAIKGGTRAGAIEQLTKLHFVPVYVRSTGRPSPGLDALRKKGAIDWPNPDSSEVLATLLANAATRSATPAAPSLLHAVEPPAQTTVPVQSTPPTATIVNTAHSVDAAVIPGESTVASAQPQATNEPAATAPSATPADRVFASVRDAALEVLAVPMNAKEFASTLEIAPTQAKAWLDRLLAAGAITKKKGKPVRYARKQSDLWRR